MIKIDRGTAFQRAVWAEIAKIKFGETMTYSEIAEKVGRSKAVRAVGTACGKNPWPYPEHAEIALDGLRSEDYVPCHRVLGKTGLGGYAFGLKRKIALLKFEKKHK
jgi:O-6-methylguanine DNA methyltransferase